MNLLEETINFLKENGKTFADVRWVGCSTFTIDIELFFKLADRNYDDGYGGAEVAQDLVVVGDDWWLERHEYDGSEWWEFKTLPQKPSETRDIKTLISNSGWESLEHLYDETEQQSEEERWYNGFV